MRHVNPIKQSLLNTRPTVGCWLTLASPAVAELLAHCGFDWLVIDAEHGPSDTQDLAAQLRAIDAAAFKGAKAAGAVRVTANDPGLVKRAMDCGARTLVFPNIDTATEAQAAQVRAGTAPDNFLSLPELSDFERSHLRDAFVVVRTMQSAVGSARGART